MNEFRTAYGPHYSSTFETGPVSKTQQSAKDDCDINVIMDRHKNGVPPAYGETRQAVYGDFSDFPDYETASVAVANANSLFANLPASIRKRFENSPGQFLDFVADPENKAEAIELGLLPKETGQEPLPPGEGVPDPVPSGDEKIVAIMDAEASSTVAPT